MARYDVIILVCINVDVIYQLIQLLQEHYRCHWYEHDPRRGSAFRSLSFDHRVDPILEKCAADVGIKVGLDKLLAHCKSLIVFVNPGEVKVMNSAAGPGNCIVIFQRQRGVCDSVAVYFACFDSLQKLTSRKNPLPVQQATSSDSDSQSDSGDEAVIPPLGLRKR